MNPIAEPLLGKMERAHRAARELEAALNDLGSSNFVDKIEAHIDVIEIQEIENAVPRRLFSVRVGGSVQWCING